MQMSHVLYIQMATARTNLDTQVLLNVSCIYLLVVIISIRPYINVYQMIDIIYNNYQCNDL